MGSRRTSDQTPALSVIMPCHNRAHDLHNVLAAYDRQAGEEAFELIAVDDASTDATLAVLRSFQPGRYTLRIEQLETNQGPAAARNRGIAQARGPLLLIVGDDIRPDPYLVQGHLAAHGFYHDEKVAVLGRVCWPEDMPVNTLMAHIDGVGAQQFSYHYMVGGQVYDYRHFYTANISLHRQFLAELDHWFDTDFTYAAFEDAELAYRLSRCGLRILYNPQLVGYHYHYHTIWTFARRQRNTGRMAHRLTAKHPDLRYSFRAQYLRILNLARRPIALLSAWPIETIERMETVVCLFLDRYEWRAHPLLDWLYLAILDYFYYDGYIQGLIKNNSLLDRVRQAHARYYLFPALKTHLRETSLRGLPLLEKQDDHLLLGLIEKPRHGMKNGQQGAVLNRKRT